MMCGIHRAVRLLLVCSGFLINCVCQDVPSQRTVYASGCSGDQVQLRCPLNHRIAIKRLFFGVKKSWECQQTPRKAECCQISQTDCQINGDSKYSTLITRCSGYQECDMLVQQMPARTFCPSAAHTDYMTVIYDCVPDVEIARFCSNDVKRGKILYLSNLEYPSSWQEQKADCMCMVRTEGGSEGLNIHSLDILLTWSEHGTRSCSKELTIKDEIDHQKNIQCGHRNYHGYRTVYTQPAQNVTITLRSSAAKGTAFVWLQATATEDDDMVEIYCGEPLRQILLRARQEVESRHRNNGVKAGGTTTSSDKGQAKNSSYPHAAHVGSLSSNLAAIIGGIVAAGFVLISIVIIAIAFHCRRVRRAKQKSKQSLYLYPAVSNGEATNLTSYCRYNDYDDDHYSSINRSPLKLYSLTESDIATNNARTNGFVTLGDRETPTHDHQKTKLSPDASSYTLPMCSPSSRDSLLPDSNYIGHLSLRISRPNGQTHNADVHDGHKTLPDNRNKILVSGPKSPLGKRSKSVTFSQPVAMVTPLPSGSEESVEGEEDFLKGSLNSSLDEGNYDNLNKIIIPDHPLSPSQIHTMSLHRHADVPQGQQGGYLGNSNSLIPRSLSTFRSPEEESGGDCDDMPFNLPPPPPPIVNGDTYATVHKKPMPLPILQPHRQNAQLYETGV